MMAVFAGFIGSSESMIKMIGFGLAIAVFFDAFVVRMAIVPAVLALLGDKAWWLPKWLDRALPNVDVEGEGLRARTPTSGGRGRGPGAGPRLTPPLACETAGEGPWDGRPHRLFHAHPVYRLRAVMSP